MNDYIKQLEDKIENLEEALSHDQELQDHLNVVDELLISHKTLEVLVRHITDFKYEDGSILFSSKTKKEAFPLEYRRHIDSLLNNETFLKV